MEQILTEIIDHLEENALDLGLSYIDENFGQLEAIDNEEDTYPLTFPAVLVELQNIQWEHTNGLRQDGTATIVVQLLIDCYDDTHAYSNQRHKVEERERLNRSVTTHLHGLRILDNTSTLTRISSNSYNASHLIKVYETTYTAKVWEKFEEQATGIIHSVRIKTSSSD